MKVKIWPRSSADKGGYACMPMEKNISIGKPDWILGTCQECGRECWITPPLKMALSQGAVALCTECTIRKVLKNRMRLKMTKSEAIKELRNIRPKGGIIPQKRAEAIDIAIKVLEKEISREQYHCEDCLHLINRTKGLRGAISGICELRNWRGRRAGRTAACKKLKKGVE